MIRRALLAASAILGATALDTLEAPERTVGLTRNLAATSSPWVHETDMPHPFEATHQCLIKSLKKVADAHNGWKIMLKIGGNFVDSNDDDYFRGVDAFLDNTLAHLMPVVPQMPEKAHVAHILQSQRNPSYSGEDLMVLATDTEEQSPDIDTAILMSTDLEQIHPYLITWIGDEEPVLMKLASNNYICYKHGLTHWCIGGKKAEGEAEFCGCKSLYGGCQPFPFSASRRRTSDSVAPI